MTDEIQHCCPTLKLQKPTDDFPIHTNTKFSKIQSNTKNNLMQLKYYSFVLQNEWRSAVCVDLRRLSFVCQFVVVHHRVGGSYL